ncbi:MAG: phosphonate degradation HD-domain oxygenase [Burkholderiales bacterium]|jgi:phosphonate degradation associated HDIG domain protein
MTLPSAMPKSLCSDHPALIDIARLFVMKGALAYGESVNQIEHALQCGVLAESAGAPDTLVTAAVLHDIGHMLHRDAAEAVQLGADDRHEILGAKYLMRWFGPAVAVPVQLHVEAKRYLCARVPGYWDTLSTLSKRTLEIQGGPFSDAQADEFLSRPHAEAAISLRQWDDLAKQPELETPSIEYFLSKARRCIRAESSEHSHRV